MANNLTKPTPGKPAMRPKNRVWGFSRNDRVLLLENRRRCPEQRRKSHPTATIFTSGIPQWPSRDPIGETGGVNLYGFVGNDGVDWVDVSGLLPSIEAGQGEKKAICHCSLIFRYQENPEFRIINGKLVLKQSIKIFKDPADDLLDCKCAKLRIAQFIQRFSENSSGKQMPVGNPGRAWRSKITSPSSQNSPYGGGWRVDWNDPKQYPMPGSVPPWIDTTDFGKPGNSNDPAQVNDFPGIEEGFNEGVRIFTCGVLENDDGKFTMAGCLEWGFQSLGSGGKFKLLDNTPRAHCGMPDAVKDAIGAWDKAFRKPQNTPWQEMDVLPTINHFE